MCDRAFFRRVGRIVDQHGGNGARVMPSQSGLKTRCDVVVSRDHKTLHIEHDVPYVLN